MRALLYVFLLVIGLTGPAHGQRMDALGARATFSGAVAKTMPAVVNIYATRRVAQSMRSPLASDPLLQQLYGRAQQPVQQRVKRSLGSGVIVSTDGVVVTNLHVIQGAEDIRVALNDGREFPAKFLNADDKTDLAVLRLQMPTNARVPAAAFGDATTLKMGDVVLALGNPFGIGQSVSMGVVSAVDRANANLSPYAQFIQTDAAINPGNSGGALIDSTGALIGINTAIFTRTGSTIGIGFAIPANLVKAVVNDIVTTGAVTRPWLGAEGQALNAALIQRLQQSADEPITGGIYVTGIVNGSPAAKAGLKKGDVILSLDSQRVEDPAALSEQIVADPALLNRTVPMTILREGERSTLNVKLESLPARSPQAQRLIGGYSPFSGLVVEQLGPSLNAELGLPLSAQGVVVVNIGTNIPPGVAPIALQPADVILRINGQPVTTVDEVTDITSQSRRKWQAVVNRAGRSVTVNAP